MAAQTTASEIISETAKAEGGPSKGSLSAQMQSQVTKQGYVEQATQDVASKMVDNATPANQTDARHVQSMQQKATGGPRPPTSSDAAQAQSVADKQQVCFMSSLLPSIRDESVKSTNLTQPSLHFC